MEVIEKGVVPMYELQCYECKSRIRYKASEVSWREIICPVCGMPNEADTNYPVNITKQKE